MIFGGRIQSYMHLVLQLLDHREQRPLWNHMPVDAARPFAGMRRFASEENANKETAVGSEARKRTPYAFFAGSHGFSPEACFVALATEFPASAGYTEDVGTKLERRQEDGQEAGFYEVSA